MAEHTIWRLTDADAEKAAAVLGRAFVDEPIFVAALPERADRERLAPSLFAANLRHACRFGEALAIGPAPGEALGVAYWVPRPEPALTAAEAAEFGFAALRTDWGSALGRMGGIEGEALVSLTDLPEPWRYLGAIGVEPDHQGRGVGSALLRRILADAARAGETVGLMTDRAENVPFYKRAGFVVATHRADGSVAWWSFATPAP